MSNTDNLEKNDLLLHNTEPIDFDAIEKALSYDRIFQDLQGGMIKSYGRKYSLYIFINFDPEKVGAIKQWIATEIAPNVTSTSSQLNNTKSFKQEIELIKQQKRDPALCYGKMCENFFLSAHGYSILLDGEQFKKVSDLDPLFTGGMKDDWKNNYRLDDREVDEAWYNPPERWDIGKASTDYPIDALISLAHDNLEELKEAANTTIDKCKEFAKIVGCEVGYAIKDSNDNCVGPFGFVDGISQPLFLKSDYEKYRNNHDLKIWDPKASLALVLKKDPFGGEYSYGSYCVWQKLETNLQLFEQKVDELATKLECDRERAGALTIGRYKDGTPLAISDRSNQSEVGAIADLEAAQLADLLSKGIAGILEFEEDSELWADELLAAWKDEQQLIAVLQDPANKLIHKDKLSSIFPMPDRPRGLETLEIEKLQSFFGDEDNMQHLGGIFLFAS